MGVQMCSECYQTSCSTNAGGAESNTAPRSSSVSPPHGSHPRPHRFDGRLVATGEDVEIICDDEPLLGMQTDIKKQLIPASRSSEQQQDVAAVSHHDDSDGQQRLVSDDGGLLSKHPLVDCDGPQRSVASRGCVSNNASRTLSPSLHMQLMDDSGARSNTSPVAHAQTERGPSLPTAAIATSIDTLSLAFESPISVGPGASCEPLHSRASRLASPGQHRLFSSVSSCGGGGSSLNGFFHQSNRQEAEANARRLSVAPLSVTAPPQLLLRRNSNTTADDSLSMVCEVLPVTCGSNTTTTAPLQHHQQQQQPSGTTSAAVSTMSTSLGQSQDPALRLCLFGNAATSVVSLHSEFTQPSQPHHQPLLVSGGFGSAANSVLSGCSDHQGTAALVGEGGGLTRTNTQPPLGWDMPKFHVLEQ